MKKLVFTFFGLLAMMPQYEAKAQLSGERIRSFAGEYAFDVVADPNVSRMLTAMLTTHFVHGVQTAVPSTLVDGRYLVVSGCVPHYCVESTVIILDALAPGAMLLSRKTPLDGDVTGTHFDRTLITNDTWSQVHGAVESDWPWSLREVLSRQN